MAWPRRPAFAKARTGSGWSRARSQVWPLECGSCAPSNGPQNRTRIGLTHY